MYRLPPETPENSGTNEAAPLLHDEACAIDADLYATGGVSGYADEAIYEPQTDIDKIVETLFLAWERSSGRKLGESEDEDLGVLGPKTLHAMSTAWRQIKVERDVLPESEVIVQGLAEAIAGYLYPLQLVVPDREKTLIIQAATAHVSEIVAESWKQILDGIEKEDAKERARKKRERRQKIRERLERQREIADVLWFYEPIAHMDHHVPLDCRLFCINLCLCFSVFVLQVPICTLLMAWPLSIGIMGGMYMTQCPMSHLMPYMMLAIGVAGTTAFLTRLSFVIYEKFSGNEISALWAWILLKAMELMFLIFLIIHLFCFFSKTPSFVLGSPEYCNETFYDFVHWINYVSIAFASVWLLVYFIKGVLTWQLRKYSLRPW